MLRTLGQQDLKQAMSTSQSSRHIPCAVHLDSLPVSTRGRHGACLLVLSCGRHDGACLLLCLAHTVRRSVLAAAGTSHSLNGTHKMTSSSNDIAQPVWPALILRLAGIYNVLWGTWAILFPNQLFDWAGMERPNHPFLWQGIGMIVGVYGIGYWLAARDFVRHWPIVLVGLLGKVLGPLGFVFNAISGTVPWSWGITCLPNDLLWWLPFGAMLYLAFKIHSDPRRQFGLVSDQLSFEQTNRSAIASNGKSLLDITQQSKVLLVFVRHAGCTFCRETLKELKAQLPTLVANQITPVVVHMGTLAEGESMLSSSGLENTLQISNPDCGLYRAYELSRGNALQLFGPVVWWKGFQAAIIKGHGFGKLAGDGFQLGGAFLLHRGKILQSYPAKNAADSIPFACILKSQESIETP